MIVQRVEPVDALFRDEGGLLLYERRLVRLSALGQHIFVATAEPVTLEELAADLARTFGEPEGDPLAATRDAVDALVVEGVLAEIGDPDGAG